MENKEFYIKYSQNQPVGVKTHLLNTHTFEWIQTVFTVGHLVAAYRTAVTPLLDHSSVAQLTLHLPDSIARSASGLGEDCFANVAENDTTLRTGLVITRLNGFGSNDLQPLIIKSKNGYAPAPQGIEATGTAVDIDTPSFGPAGYKSRNNVCFPFFDHSNS